MGKPLERFIEEYRTHGLNREADDLSKSLARFRKRKGFPEEYSVPVSPTEARVAQLQTLRAKYEGRLKRPEFYTPEFQTQFWRDFYADDPSIVVPECTWTEEAMRRSMIGVRGDKIAPMLVYKLDVFNGPAGLVRLGKRYPYLGDSTVREGTRVNDEHVTSGYVKVEAVHDAPNRDTTEQELVDFLDTEKHPENQNLRGQREGTYAIFGEALFVLTGKRPDLNTVSRLPGSRYEGDVVHAYRDSGGGLVADWLLVLRGRNPRLGARFEEVQST